jgi:hypothetical protein
MQMISERMYMKELKKELPWRDFRAIKKWCIRNHVQLFSFDGTKIRFVLRDEFERQMEKIYNSKPLDKGSKKFSSRKNLKRNLQPGTDYKPKGEYEKEALSIFTNLSSEL